jgi:hypothetical protein
MKRLILTAALMGMFALCAQDSPACSCIMPDVPQAFHQARAVFVGEVAEIIKPRTDNHAAPPADRLYTVKFRVEKSWKGAGFQEVTVPEIILLSDQGRAGCFSWGSFVEGSKYLVYAEETKDGNMGVLFSCNRTASLTTASKDLKELERMSKPSFNRKRSSGKLAARRA